MTLTTHALVGVAAAKIFSFHPVAAFCAAFLSHFFIDAIPHWDYHLASARNEETKMDMDMEIGPEFYRDLLKIGFDVILAFILAYILFQPANDYQMMITLLGASGGILPDPLQFLYFKFRHEPLVSLERFHIWIHTDVRLLNGKFGVPFQAGLVLVCLFVSSRFLW